MAVLKSSRAWAFPSPCGDKLKCEFRVAGETISMFPSPCGDKLKFATAESYYELSKFPSPCGDKLKYDAVLAVHIAA